MILGRLYKVILNYTYLDKMFISQDCPGCTISQLKGVPKPFILDSTLLNNQLICSADHITCHNYFIYFKILVGINRYYNHSSIEHSSTILAANLISNP